MNILITGKNSYVGKSIKTWLEQNESFMVDELDLKDGRWSNYDFSIYHSVIHVAGIVHRSKEEIGWDVYYRVNTLLPTQVASIAKASGVKQFIFISTMGIYGQEKKLPYGNCIDSSTPIAPVSFYGKSKYGAEVTLNELHDEGFKVCIVRPPNIYGKECPGNYFKGFVKMTSCLPIFPMAFRESKQSLIYIDNLCEFIRLLITHTVSGTYMPQDEVQVSTVEFISCIATAINKKIRFSKALGTIVQGLYRLSIVKKVFGGVSYDAELSKINIGDYIVVPFKEAVLKSIRGD